MTIRTGRSVRSKGRRHPGGGTNRHRQWPVALIVLVATALVVACSGTTNDKNMNGDRDPGANPTAVGPLSSELVADIDGLWFTDVSQQAGLTAVQSIPELVYEQTMSSGAAVADVDGDGFDDIFLTRAGRPNVLYMNNGDGTFRDATESAGLAEPEPTYGSSAAAFFDANGNGSLDLFVTGFGRGPNRFYINDGEGRFSEATVEHGFVFPPLDPTEQFAQMHGVTVADVNGDGALDVLVLHWFTAAVRGDMDQIEEMARELGHDGDGELQACEIVSAIDALRSDGRGSDQTGNGTEGSTDDDFRTQLSGLESHSTLFVNDGAGHFTNMTEEMGLEIGQMLAFTGAFNDFDGDGWPDLMITGDGCTSRLFRNVDGRRFVDVTDEAGIGTDENGMGVVFDDLNGDGLPDLLISAISYGEPDDSCPVGGSLVGCSGNRAYLNNGDGTFVDATIELGLRDGGWGWGIAVEDFANTGGVQVAMTNGYRQRNPNRGDGVEPTPFDRFMDVFHDDPTRFWVRDSSGPFRDAAAEVGITDTGVGHALIPFDYNNDGKLDLLVVPAGEAPILYRNDGPDDHSWLTIRLSDPTNPGNPWGDGARVEVFTTSDPGTGGTTTDGRSSQREGSDRDWSSQSPRIGWITTSGSYESQKPPQFHLGFGNQHEPVSRIDIYWPGETTPQRVDDVELNQRIVIERT